MRKKIIFVFIGLLIFTNEIVFSEEEIIIPKNVIAIEIGYTISSLIVWGIKENPFFVTAIQYERQISESVSLGGRFDYRIMSFPDFDSRTDLSSFSFEAHIRYYPERNVFFVDGMLGYAGFIYYSSFANSETVNSISHYFKFGGKLGWRIDFGKPGGFILEPSIGYYGAIGSTNIDFSNRWLNLLYEHFIIKGFFVGGPQFSLCLGYRF